MPSAPRSHISARSECFVRVWWHHSFVYQDGLYHHFSHELSHGCGLTQWFANSYIRRATSKTIDGIYQPQEVVAGAYATNIGYSRTELNAPVAGLPPFVLLHLGDSDRPGSMGGGIQNTTCEGHQVVECSAGYSCCSYAYCPNSTHACPADAGTQGERRQPPTLGEGGKERGPAQSARASISSFPAQVSASLNSGNWSTVQITCAVDDAGIADCPAVIGHHDSPSGWVDENGSAWILFTLRGNNTIRSGRGGSGCGLARAPIWSGPYRPVTGYWDQPVLFMYPGMPELWAEDNTIYRDSRGGFHMICHFYGGTPELKPDFGCHAHAAADGRAWSFSGTAAFGPNVTFDQPTEEPAQLGYRQRPHVVMSDVEPGLITHVVNGVVSDAARPYKVGDKLCTEPSMTYGPCDRAWTIHLWLWAQSMATTAQLPHAYTNSCFLRYCNGGVQPIQQKGAWGLVWLVSD